MRVKKTRLLGHQTPIMRGGSGLDSYFNQDNQKQFMNLHED